MRCAYDLYFSQYYGTLPEIITAVMKCNIGIRSITRDSPDFTFDRSARETTK